MSLDSVALRQKRANVLEQCRSIVDTAETRPEAERSLTGEEQTRYKALWSEQKELQERFEQMESLEKAERDLKTPANADVRSQPGGNPSGKKPGNGEPAQREVPGDLSFRAGGWDIVPEGIPEYLHNSQYREAFRKTLRSGDFSEMRSFAVGNITQAGVLVAPVQLVQQILKFMDNQVFLLNASTKFNLPTAAKLQIPQLLDDPDEPDIVYELSAGSDDVTMDFGAQWLEPHPVGKSFLISRDLIRMSLIDIEAFVMQRLAYKFGVHWEKQMMLGNGVQSPMGLFTPSAQGIPTSRDVNTYNTQTGPTFDGLKAAKYSLREMYMNKASWIFHRTIMEYISILKDGNGRYLLQDSTEEGEPDMLLGRPVRLSEYAPNTNTTGQYVGIFGDFSYVWTAIAYDMEVVPLFETSFKTNQVEYVARQSLDARPVMPEAFARITNT